MIITRKACMNRIATMIILDCKTIKSHTIYRISKYGDGAPAPFSGRPRTYARDEIRRCALLLPAPCDRLATLLLPVASHHHDAHRILPRWAFFL